VGQPHGGKNMIEANIKEFEKKIKFLYNEKKTIEIDNLIINVLKYKIDQFNVHLIYLVKNGDLKSIKTLLDDSQKDIQKYNSVCFNTLGQNLFKNDVFLIYLKKIIPDLYFKII
jgi:hypothetical protein